MHMMVNIIPRATMNWVVQYHMKSMNHALSVVSSSYSNVLYVTDTSGSTSGMGMGEAMSGDDGGVGAPVPPESVVLDTESPDSIESDWDAPWMLPREAM